MENNKTPRSLKVSLETVTTIAVLVAAITVIAFQFQAPAGSSGLPPGTREFKATLDVRQAPAFGDADAPVGVVMFSDFECSFCQSASSTLLPALKTRYADKGQVRVFFKHFPLDSIHTNARRMGELAACAGVMGQFWPVHDMFFEKGLPFETVTADMVASRTGIDRGQLAQCAAEVGKSIVSKDAAEGDKLGIAGTPAFFLGNLDGGDLKVTRRIDGTRGLQAFSDVIDQLIRNR